MSERSCFWVAAIIVLMVALGGCSEKMTGPASVPEPSKDYVIRISVDADGLTKCMSALGTTYYITATFTSGKEVLPDSGKSYYVAYDQEHRFVVTAEDGIPMTNIKVNSNTPPATAWYNGQYWFKVPFNKPELVWLEKSQGWKEVKFTFKTDLEKMDKVYFLGECTDSYPDGWQRVPMDMVGSDSAYVTLANAVEVTRHCNIVVVYDSKEAWLPRWLWANGTRLDHGTVTRDSSGAIKKFTIDYKVHTDGGVQTTGPDLLDGLVVYIKP